MIALIIPTYNSCNDLARLLKSLNNQNTTFDLIIVDSGSTDGTAELAKKKAARFFSIPSNEFNHGGTRQMMIDKNPDYDVYIFMTQDAYLENEYALSNLIEPFKDPNVGAVCGRQLPHHDATLIASHARLFNYPENSEIKSYKDVARLGIKAAFMSNSFAAYRTEALKQVNSFPKHVIFGEDMYVAANMLLNQWKIGYASNALCRHSHNYCLIDEFHRYFDMGVFHRQEPWLKEKFGGASGEGMSYVKSELKYLGLSYLYIWPSAMLRNFFKLLAYKLGQQEQYLSINLKKKLGMHKKYWSHSCSGK